MTFMSSGTAWILNSNQKSEIVSVSNDGERTSQEDNKSPVENGMDLSWEGMAKYSSLIRSWYSSPGHLSDSILKRAYLALRLVLVFVFYTAMGTFTLVGFRLLQLIMHPKRSSVLQWNCLVLICLGIVLTLFLSMSGASQVYFLESSLLFAVIFGLYESPKQATNKLYHITTWIVAGPLVFLCVINAWSFNKPVLLDGINMIKSGKVVLTSRFPDAYESNIVTPQEELGYEWIQKNTDSDAILITNATVHANGPLKTSVFAARRMYMESNAAPSVSREEADKRYALTEAFMKGEEQAYLELRDFGVDYAIILKRFETGEEYTRHLRCVYENEDIAIYSMNN